MMNSSPVTSSLAQSILRGVIRYRYGLLLFGMCILCFVALGAFVLGPFIDSPIYAWVREEKEVNYWADKLIDVQGLLLDKLISTIVPVFFAWSFALYLYSALGDIGAAAINKASRVLRLFSGGTSLYIAAMGGAIVGICIYGFYHYDFTPKLFATLIIGSIILTAGIFIRTAEYVHIEDRPVLRKWASKLATLAFVLGVGAHVYSLAAHPMQLWLIVHDAYNQR